MAVERERMKLLHCYIKVLLMFLQIKVKALAFVRDIVSSFEMSTAMRQLSLLRDTEVAFNIHTYSHQTCQSMLCYFSIL